MKIKYELDTGYRYFKLESDDEKDGIFLIGGFEYLCAKPVSEVNRFMRVKDNNNTSVHDKYLENYYSLIEQYQKIRHLIYNNPELKKQASELEKKIKSLEDYFLKKIRAEHNGFVKGYKKNRKEFLKHKRRKIANRKKLNNS